MIQLLLILLLASCATAPKKSPAPTKASPFVLLDHKWFRVHYDPDLRLARWVEYTLRREDLLVKVGKRKDKFRPDPLLLERRLPTAALEDYKNTGFDRGHLAPAADFSFSQEANDETFVLSNIAPQTKKLNRGAWLRLEDEVRKWACGEGKVTILTGPIFAGTDRRLPKGLRVPQRFFKIVIDETPPRKTRAFIHHQEDPKTSLRYREFPVAEVERQAGIKFPVAFPPENGVWHSEDCRPRKFR